MSLPADSVTPAFRTVVPLRPLPFPIGHGMRVVSVGSCFSEHIAEHLETFRFDVCANPSGVLYNPLSIVSLLNRLIEGRMYGEHDLFAHDGLVRSYDHHTSFAAPDTASCLERINASFEQARNQAARLDTLIVTFGTAFAYRLADTGRVVANCHKLPHDRFARELVPIRTIADEVSAVLEKLSAGRKRLQIIVTISPVRHLRDNFHENQVSKSHLLAAVYQLEQNLKNVYYFPAYEIFMDELRDYRFYNDDMVHPAPAAVNYVWQRFCSACIEERSRWFIEHYAPIVAARNHRIRNTSPEMLRAFAEHQIQAVDSLQRQYPDISLAGDRDYFASL